MQLAADLRIAAGDRLAVDGERGERHRAVHVDRNAAAPCPLASGAAGARARPRCGRPRRPGSRRPRPAPPCARAPAAKRASPASSSCIAVAVGRFDEQHVARGGRCGRREQRVRGRPRSPLTTSVRGSAPSISSSDAGRAQDVPGGPEARAHARRHLDRRVVGRRPRKLSRIASASRSVKSESAGSCFEKPLRFA